MTTETATVVEETTNDTETATEAVESSVPATTEKASKTSNSAKAAALFNEKTKNLAAKPHTQNQMVPLSLITVSYNVRNVFPVLSELGYEYIKLIKMAISSNQEDKEKFVALVDEHEAFRKDREEEQTFFELAESIFDVSQIEAIRVRQLGTSDNKDAKGNVIGKKYSYGIVTGGRRTAAIAYLFARGMWNGPQANVKAELVRADSKRELMEISIAENLQRKEFSEREIGEIVKYYVEEEKLKWDDITKKLHRSIPFLKGCYVLVNPVGDAPNDILDKLERGEIKKGDAVLVASGKATMTSNGSVEPATLGDGKSRLTTGSPQRTLPVAGIRALIDATPLDNKAVNVARITAFAEAIQSDYDTEVKGSQERRDKAAKLAKEAAAAQKNGKNGKGKNGKK